MSHKGQLPQSTATQSMAFTGSKEKNKEIEKINQLASKKCYI